MLIDTHCHLNSEEFENILDSTIKESIENKVDRLIVVGWDLKSSRKAFEIANKYENVFAIVGFGPMDLKDISETALEEIKNMMHCSKVVALGEIGLDYYWEKDPAKKEEQKKWFIRQIQLGNACKKPICIHNREAFEDCINILKKYKPEYGAVMHCYSGSVEYLSQIMNLGLYIGLDGPVTYKNAITPKEVAKEAPIDRLLLETDCPYLTPHPYRGTMNKPKNLVLIAEKIAELRGISLEELAIQTTKNAKKLFNL